MVILRTFSYILMTLLGCIFIYFCLFLTQQELIDAIALQFHYHADSLSPMVVKYLLYYIYNDLNFTASEYLHGIILADADGSLSSYDKLLNLNLQSSVMKFGKLDDFIISREQMYALYIFLVQGRCITLLKLIFLSLPLFGYLLYDLHVSKKIRNNHAVYISSLRKSLVLYTTFSSGCALLVILLIPMAISKICLFVISGILIFCLYLLRLYTATSKVVMALS